MAPRSFIKANPEGNFGSLHGSIGWGILFINVFALLAGITAYFLYEPNGNIYTISAFIYFCLPIVLIMKAGRQTIGYTYGMIYTLICWGILLLLYAEAAQYINFYHKQKVVKNISVREAYKYPDADVFYFVDGKILFDEYGDTHYDDSDDGSGSTTTYAVPFVNNNWDKRDSIYVWLVGEERHMYSTKTPFKYSDFYEDLQYPYKSGIVLKGFMGEGNSLYAEAIKSVETHNHLKVSAKPIFLQWLNEPEKHIKEKILLYMNILFYINISWIGFVIIHRIIYLFRKDKPKKTGLSED